MTLSHADLDRLAKALRALVSPLAVADAGEWAACIARELRALLGADRMLLMLPGAGAGGLWGDGIGPEVLDAYASYYGALDHGFRVRRKELGVEVWSRRLLWAPAELRSSEYYNDFVVPNRLYDAVGLTIEVDGRGPAGLSFYHARPAGARFGGRATEVLRLLQPAFRAGIEVWTRSGLARDGIRHLLDAIEDGLLLYDGGGRILHENRRLREMLACDPAQAALRRELERIAASFDRLGRARPDPTSGGRERLTADLRTPRGVYRLRGSLVDIGAGAPTTCILVSLEAGALALPSGEELRGTWGLTGRQAQVARLLAQGKSNAEIAAMLAISPHTARRHTESVLMKLGIHSRAEVAATLLRGH